MLQLVFNKILTLSLDQFWVKKHGWGGGWEGRCGRSHTAFYIKGNSLWLSFSAWLAYFEFKHIFSAWLAYFAQYCQNL